MVSWRVYYDDSSVLSDDDASAVIRADGVIVIVETDRATFWRCHVFGEVYGKFDGRWHAAHVIKKSWPDSATVLYGKLVSDEIFRSIRQEAMGWLHPAA